MTEICPSCGSDPTSLFRCFQCGTEGVGVEYIPITYDPKVYSHIANTTLEELKKLDWVQHDSVPRMEYYINSENEPYQYGIPEYAREYKPQPSCFVVDTIREYLEERLACKFEVCFLNRYINQSMHLGWHSDNSPEMDDNRPIVIVSFGAERDIKFRKIGSNSAMSIKLGNGSVCIMHPGMQDTHQHRIPKSGNICGERISLTFRGYKL